MYLFILRLHESLNAQLVTSTMMETYALVVIDVFKIVILATKYVRLGNSILSELVADLENYWKAMFDPQDELFKLTRRFDHYAVQQMASQISQISLLLQRHQNRIYTTIDDVSRQVGLIYKESIETSRNMSAIVERLNTGHKPPLDDLTLEAQVTRVKSFHEQIEDLKKWLKVPPNTEDEFTTFKSRKMRGTCEWIFKDERFQRWKTSDGPVNALLWIHARAGRGKSVLAATIVQYLQYATRGTPDACVYFFCRSDDEAKKSPHSILRSTAYWLAQRNDTIRWRLMEVLSKYPELRIEELPLASLWDRLFMNCICDAPPAGIVPYRIYWVIDALDECDSNQRASFTKMLAELGEEHCGISFK